MTKLFLVAVLFASVAVANAVDCAKKNADGSCPTGCVPSADNTTCEAGGGA